MNDDLARGLAVSRPDGRRSVAVAGDTYTTLVAGADTNGRFAVIEAHVPPGGGPPMHRHAFEETFIVLDGTIEVTFRSQTAAASAGASVNVPSGAPHRFENRGDAPVRMLLVVSPAGLEEMFAKAGDTVNGPTSAPPALDEQARHERMRRLGELAPLYGVELLIGG